MKKEVLIVLIVVFLLSSLVSAQVSHPIYKQEIKEITPSSQEGVEMEPEQRISSVGIATYYYGSGLIAKEENGEISYYHMDNLGSTRAITGGDGEKIIEINYLPYGSSLSSSDETFTFTGKELDSSGLQYFGARYYDPNLGRFITTDPIQEGPNWYSYVLNNPLKYVDLKGLQEEPLQGPTILGPTLDEAIENLGFDPSSYLVESEKYANNIVRDEDMVVGLFEEQSTIRSLPARIQVLAGSESVESAHKTFTFFVGLVIPEDEEKIQEFYSKVDYIADITDDPEERLFLAYGLVRNTFEFKDTSLYTLDVALSCGQGACENYAEAFSSALTRLGIESYHRYLPTHSLVAVRLNGQTFDMDPAYQDNPQWYKHLSDEHIRNVAFPPSKRKINIPFETYDSVFRELVH